MIVALPEKTSSWSNLLSSAASIKHFFNSYLFMVILSTQISVAFTNDCLFVSEWTGIATEGLAYEYVTPHPPFTISILHLDLISSLLS